MMENLKLTRIDFRLIHGQVMTRWVAKYEIESIVVIDDRSAKSPILKKILLGAAPSGVKVLVWNVAEAAEKWKAEEFPKNNLLILFKNTSQAKAAWEAGVNFPSLQVGGIEGSGDKKNIYKNGGGGVKCLVSGRRGYFHAADSRRQSVSVQGCSGEILAVYPIKFDHMEVMNISYLYDKSKEM